MAIIIKKKNENDIIIEGIESQISRIELLKREGKNGINFTSWQNLTTRILERITGSENSFAKHFRNIKYTGIVNLSNYEDDLELFFEKGLNEAKVTLEDIINELKTYGAPPVKNNNTMESNNKNNVTVNLNQNININISNVLKNHLSTKQYQEAKTILETKDQKQRDSKLSEFLVSLGSSVLVEIIKGLLLGG